MFRRPARKRTGRRRAAPTNVYLNLEDRRLLSVSAIYDMGVLTVALNEAADQAIVDVVNGNVTVNGNTVDADPMTPGVQPATVDDITNLTFVGKSGLTDLSVQLNGVFDTDNLISVGLNNINQTMLNGSYRTMFFNGNLTGDDGTLGGPGMIVATSTNLHSQDAVDIELVNSANDFEGLTSISTRGDVQLQDENNLFLFDLDIGGSLTLAAPNGFITDTLLSSIRVEFATVLDALTVDLGGNGPLTDLFVVISNVAGEFSLKDEGTLVWASNSTVGSAHVSAGFLTMGPQANITVIGDAVFEVDSMRIGVGGLNSFQAERLSVSASGNVFVWQNSSVELFSDISAANLDLIVDGDISNAEGMTFEVLGISSFQSTADIVIGNQSNDQFNSGSVQFFGNRVNIFEDSELLVSGQQNTADSLWLSAMGAIVDADDSYLGVNGHARFVSTAAGSGVASVVLGDSDDDFFVAGSVSFEVVGGGFALRENDSVLISSMGGFVNRAAHVDIVAMGNLANAAGTSIQVSGNALFEGTVIELGDELDDNLQFGSTTITAGSNVKLYQDSSIFFTGRSFVGGDLDAVATGTIADSMTSRLNVVQHARFEGAAITLGDSGAPAGPGDDGDIFRASTLQFYSDGNVAITEDGDMVLDSENHANVLRLETVDSMAADGSISNLAGTILDVASNLFVKAVGNITLGSDPGDTIRFDNLNFNSPGVVDITANFDDVNSEFFIFGGAADRNAAAELYLTTNANVRNGTETVIVVDDILRMTARSITLGDSETDCIMLPEDRMFMTTNGAFVTLDESCDP